jgi:hypothetical protein
MSMMTEPNEVREFIEEISKRIVTQLAPEELALFDELSEAYFTDPRPPQPIEWTGQRLGFGLNNPLPAATQATLAVVTMALSYMLTEVYTTTQEENPLLFKQKIRQLFDPQHKTEELTPAQLQQLQHLAVKQAERFGLDIDKAEQMAKTLVGSLALAA